MRLNFFQMRSLIKGTTGATVINVTQLEAMVCTTVAEILLSCMEYQKDGVDLDSSK